MKTILMPVEPPSCIPDNMSEEGEFDEVLFELCRNDDYHGLYREFVRRVKGAQKSN